jgi:hypothetical protein
MLSITAVVPSDEKAFKSHRKRLTNLKGDILSYQSQSHRKTLREQQAFI